MYKDKEMAYVKVDYANKTVEVINYTDNILFRPFGVNTNPTLEDLDKFLESRCFPKDRMNCKQLLKDLGLVNYSPLLIVMKTHGRQFEDYCWVKFKGEDVDYNRDVKIID